MMARASLGSRCSISSMEPLISANNAVTVFRSPSDTSDASVAPGVIRISGALASALGDGAAPGCALPGSGEPHSPQNFLPGGFSELQLGQRLSSGAPQSPQNLLPAGLSLPHFEQRIIPDQTALNHQYSQWHRL